MPINSFDRMPDKTPSPVAAKTLTEPVCTCALWVCNSSCIISSSLAGVAKRVSMTARFHHSLLALTISLLVAGCAATAPAPEQPTAVRSEEHTSELQSRENLVCRLLLEKKKKT